VGYSSLAPESLHLVQRTVDVTDGRIHLRDGTSAADILAVPEPWPVLDDRQSSIWREAIRWS
jgi:hypothetical protein